MQTISRNVEGGDDALRCYHNFRHLELVCDNFKRGVSEITLEIALKQKNGMLESI